MAATIKHHAKMRLRKGDMVRLLRGRDRGKKGKVMAVFPREQRLVIEGLNLVKKHVRPRRAGEKGQRVSVPAPVPVSNVQLICPHCKKSTRVGIVHDQDGVSRLCKQCHSKID